MMHLILVVVLAATPAQTVVFLNESAINVAELNDVLTQVYFIHTENHK